MHPGVDITPARFPNDAGVVRALFEEYAASLDFSLCFQGFDHELATLPGRYAEPEGVVLLARVGGEAVGCVGLREIGPDACGRVTGRICEMKRMWVRPAFRRLGLGRLLAEDLIARARARGYAAMRLDSMDSFTPALTLYRSLGFANIPAYNDDPDPHTVWMELTLDRAR